MKTAAIILIVVVFAGTLLPYASVMAAPVYSPHEDPATGA